MRAADPQTARNAPGIRPVVRSSGLPRDGNRTRLNYSVRRCRARRLERRRRGGWTMRGGQCRRRHVPERNRRTRIGCSGFLRGANAAVILKRTQGATLGLARSNLRTSSRSGVAVQAPPHGLRQRESTEVRAAANRHPWHAKENRAGPRPAAALYLPDRSDS